MRPILGKYMGAHTTTKQGQNKYIGRFAPSPTGPLHYGSLIAAVASYLQAKNNNGHWLLRIEDIDPPREVKGAADEIIRTLERYKFEWDQQPLFQSTQYEIYREKIEILKQQQLIYACSCSRKQINEKARDSILGKRYPGTCKTKRLELHNSDFRLRLHTTNSKIHFRDAAFGDQECVINNDIGDFIIYRKHDLPAYALAVTIDDAYQEITEVVRGYDLLAFTPLQIYLCQLLNFPVPTFLHVPLIVDKYGEKLSKQTLAKELPLDNRNHTLVQALNDLGQDVPENLVKERINTIWQWAIDNWDITKIPASHCLPYYQ